MKKVLSLVCAGVLALATLSSCCSATSVVGISSNTAIGSKVGESTQWTILCFGKGGPKQSIKSAAENGNIKTVSHVEEYNTLYVGGIVAKHTIRVYGE